MPLLGVELRRAAPYVKGGIFRGSGSAAEDVILLKAVGLAEIERIFTVTDALGISREALMIPLRTEHPGRVRKLGAGKLEIVVDRDAEFDQWLSRLETAVRAVWPVSPPD